MDNLIVDNQVSPNQSLPTIIITHILNYFIPHLELKQRLDLLHLSSRYHHLLKHAIASCSTIAITMDTIKQGGYTSLGKPYNLFTTLGYIPRFKTTYETIQHILSNEYNVQYITSPQHLAIRERYHKVLNTDIKLRECIEIFVCKLATLTSLDIISSMHSDLDALLLKLSTIQHITIIKKSIDYHGLQLKHLQSITIQYTTIEEKLANVITTHPTIRSLTILLNLNNLYYNLDKYLPQLPTHIKRFELIESYYNQSCIGKEFITWVGNQQHVEHLVLSRIQICDNLIHILPKMTSLKYLLVNLSDGKGKPSELETDLQRIDKLSSDMVSKEYSLNLISSFYRQLRESFILNRNWYQYPSIEIRNIPPDNRIRNSTIDPLTSHLGGVITTLLSETSVMLTRDEKCVERLRSFRFPQKVINEILMHTENGNAIIGAKKSYYSVNRGTFEYFRKQYIGRVLLDKKVIDRIASENCIITYENTNAIELGNISAIMDQTNETLNTGRKLDIYKILGQFSHIKTLQLDYQNPSNPFIINYHTIQGLIDKYINITDNNDKDKKLNPQEKYKRCLQRKKDLKFYYQQLSMELYQPAHPTLKELIIKGIKKLYQYKYQLIDTRWIVPLEPDSVMIIPHYITHVTIDDKSMVSVIGRSPTIKHVTFDGNFLMSGFFDKLVKGNNIGKFQQLESIKLRTDNNNTTKYIKKLVKIIDSLSKFKSLRHIHITTNHIVRIERYGIDFHPFTVAKSDRFNIKFEK